MSQRATIARYNLIINKLRKRPSSYKEIADYLKLESEIQSYNFNISKRTLQRDIQDIYSLYNIEIKFDYRQKVYRISFNTEPEIGERILEAFDTFNALNISDRLSGFIHLEKRHPAGTDNLFGLLHAIKNKVRIKFEYHKFWDDISSFRIAEPYALKEFKHRWYVLANDVNDNKVKSFALDRLSNLEITKTGFEIPVSFNLEENYRYCFGIISPEDDLPAEIVLSYDAFQGKYIKTMPLHDTQKVLVDNETELRIGLKLFITHDLIMELLSFGSSMKVLKPQSLAKEIKEEIKRALSNY
jgi:predicted DNA-binding transcriptional regulator YafY